jgi:hypothetical protein
MNAFSPTRLSDLTAGDMFTLPASVPPAPVHAGVIGRIYDRFVDALRGEPALTEMGPSQIHELMVMRGRD